MREFNIEKSITPRNNRSLEIYLTQIGKYSLLTPEQEVELAKKIRESNYADKESIDKLVNANLRFVVSVAKQYRNTGLSLEDLINEGNLGLIKAVKRFNETKGFKFISYAVWWIQQSILEAIAKKSHIITPPLINNTGKSIKTINEIIERFFQKNEREPTPEELSQILEINEERLEKILNSHKIHSSFDAPIREDGENTFIDLQKGYIDSPDHHTADKESLKKDLEEIFKILSPKEKEVLELFFGIGKEYAMTLEDIGNKLEFTKERVRQIKKRALKKIQKNTTAKNLLKTYHG